jgi:hypothetical protein
MEISESRRDFLRLRDRLLNHVYSGDSHYRDAVTPLLEMVLVPSGKFAARADILPITVREGDRPLVSALLITAHGMGDTLQVSFFEAVRERQDAVDLLMQRARELADAAGQRRIVIGLNGHVNNGLGFLAGPYDKPACFGGGYNPPYYIDYLSRFSTSQGNLVSYAYDLSVTTMDREKKVLERISRRFKVREADFSDLRREIALYTRLNNECFVNHPLYFNRTEEEDYELFKSFGPFLKEENLLVSELNGRPIGFLLWYPDFNELVGPGGKLGLLAALKYRLPGHQISRFRVAEVGVLPEFQGSAAIGGLVQRCVEIAKQNGHRFCESGWIFDDNFRSWGISSRWADCVYKTYRYFEINMHEAGK